MRWFLCIFLLVQMFIASGQVNDIKKASSGNSKSGGGDSRNSSGGSGFFINFFVDAISGLADWQQYKLKKKELNPYIVSLDIIAPLAIQPSRYYLFNPRIRGNWGLFSTDFRVNYLLQETVKGTEDLSSLDWQIIQLNMVTTRNVIGRVGVGFMRENFGGRESFFESTYGVFIQSNNKKMGVSMEFRLAQDFYTNAVPRMEWSAQYEQRIFSSGYWNTYFTIGGVYQRYYELISVWGIQAGLAFRIFSPPLQHEP